MTTIFHSNRPAGTPSAKSTKSAKAPSSGAKAFQALFRTPDVHGTQAASSAAQLSALPDFPALLSQAEASEAPHALDALILGDAERTWEGPVFRWYAGTDAQGVQRTFRFQRGLPLSQWHQALRTQGLTCVQGPFRTPAQSVHAPSPHTGHASLPQRQL